MNDDLPDLNAGDFGLIHVDADWGWVGWMHPERTSAHTLPIADVGGHALDASCACGPIEPFPGHYVHMSFDGREAYEQGLRKHH